MIFDSTFQIFISIGLKSQILPSREEDHTTAREQEMGTTGNLLTTTSDEERQL